MSTLLHRLPTALLVSAQLLVACATGTTVGEDEGPPASRDALESTDPLDSSDAGRDSADAPSVDVAEIDTAPADDASDELPQRRDGEDSPADAGEDSVELDAAGDSLEPGADAVDGEAVDDAAQDADVEAADVPAEDTATAEDTSQPPLTLDGVLAALDADRGGTLQRLAWSDGWPVTLDDGTALVVSTDASLTSVAGAFNSWAQAPMTLRGSYRWARITPASGGYKFTDGARWVADPWSRHYTFDENGEMSLIRPSTPHLQRFPSMPAAGLLPRTIRVWVPQGPVTHTLYMHDGQNLFDPRAPFGTWGVQNRAPAGLMVVGIDNTTARMSDYTHVTDNIGGTVGGDAELYARFVHNELRPWVDEQFGEADRVGVLGSSLGGLVSLVMLHEFPDGWDFVGSMSGTVGWGKIASRNPTILDLLAEPSFDTDAVIYIDSGGGADNCTDSDGDGMRDDGSNNRDNYCENLQLRDQLASRGFTFNTNLFHWHEPNAAHNEAAWSARLARPLQIFMDL
jgi:predicted alpha/beta superfamily hydrolase